MFDAAASVKLPLVMAGPSESVVRAFFWHAAANRANALPSPEAALAKIASLPKLQKDDLLKFAADHPDSVVIFVTAAGGEQ